LLLVLSITCALAVARGLPALDWRPMLRWAAVALTLAAAVMGLYLLRQSVALAWLAAAEGVMLLAALAAVRSGSYRRGVALLAVPALVAIAALAIPSRLPDVAPFCWLCGLSASDPLSVVVRVIAEQRQLSLASGGVFAPGALQPMTTPVEMLALIPVAVSNVLLAPYPTTWLQPGQTVGAVRLLASVEGIAFYLLLLPLLVGAWRTLRRGMHGAMFVVLLALTLAVVTGLVATNEGTLFRLRDAPIALLVLVGVAGWSMSGWGRILRWRLVRPPQGEPSLRGRA
jgi:hypothetical protein